MAVRPLSSALQSLPFANSGIVNSALNITTDYVDVIYLEPEAPTKARWSWADGALYPPCCIKPNAADLQLLNNMLSL